MQCFAYQRTDQQWCPRVISNIFNSTFCLLSNISPEANWYDLSYIVLQFISYCAALSSVRGRGPLNWTFPDPQRFDSSEGVKVEQCDSRHHSHSHCSKLTVTRLSANDTGRYSCKYSSYGSDHITSTYVYVEGETCKVLFAWDTATDQLRLSHSLSLWNKSVNL